MATTSSVSSTNPTTQPVDYLGALGSLSPAPFNPNTIINALIAAQQAPITNLQGQVTNIQADQKTYASIAGDVGTLQSAAFLLTLQSSVQANAATSSNPSLVTATAGPNAQAGTYTIAVNTLATATKATSTAATGSIVDTAAATSTPLNQLNLRATPTAGSFSVVVDGHVQTMTADPTKPLLDPSGALAILQATLAASLSGDPSALVNVGMSGDKVSIGISGAGSPHTISFGAVGDTSNFLSVMNLATAQGSTTAGALTLNSSAAVGVAQTTAPLSTAGLATPLNAGSGSFTINGAHISWNAATDTINTVINNINNSTAGVTAQYNNLTDSVVLASKTTGQSAITMQDNTSNFLTAMNLAPGTTTAQQLGTNASLTVNGTAVSSQSNTFTNAIPGMTINALGGTLMGSPATVTVAPDTAGITKSVQSFVDAANKVLSEIDATQQKDATTGHYGRLLGDANLRGLHDRLVTLVTGQITGSGAYRSLQDIGITTGAVGSKVGTTSSLSLNPTKLAAALAANPSQVAALFNGTTATVGFQGAAQRLSTYLGQQANTVNGPFALQQTSGNAQIKTIQDRVTQMQSQLAARRLVLVAKFSAMTTILGNLSAETAALSSIGVNTTSSSSSSSGH